MRKSIKETRASCFVHKNRSKKRLIFQKLEHFKNCQKWPQCKGYSTCKILSLDQKIKLPKTCEKRFFKHIKVVLCQKEIEQQLIFEKRAHFKNCQSWPQCKGYSTCKILSLDQKIKLPKTCEKRFYKHIKVALCQKQIEKTANIRKMRAF